MASYTWNGGTGSYLDPTQWTPSTVPLYGLDTVAVINAGTVSLSGTEPNGITLLWSNLDNARPAASKLVLDNGVLMAGDAMPGCAPYEGMKGFSLALTYDEASAARDVFARLSEGGSVTMAMESTFWADAFGMLVDRFGTPWIINGGMKAS